MSSSSQGSNDLAPLGLPLPSSVATLLSLALCGSGSHRTLPLTHRRIPRIIYTTVPALPPIAKVIRVRVIGTDSADNEVGTHFTLQYTGTAGTTAEYNTLATTISNEWNTYLAPVTPSDFTLTSVVIQDLSSATSPQGMWTGTIAGSRSGSGLPLNVAFSLEYQTNLRRRGGRWHGQWRFGVDGDLATQQTWSGSAITAFLTAFEDFIAAVIAAVWSGGGALTHIGVQYNGPPNRIVTSASGRVHTASTPLVTPLPYAVVSYAAKPRLGSQRKRLGKL